MENNCEEINGEELKKILETLKSLKEDFSNLEFNNFPINCIFGGKDLEIKFSVDKKYYE